MTSKKTKYQGEKGNKKNLEQLNIKIRKFITSLFLLSNAAQHDQDLKALTLTLSIVPANVEI